MLLGVDYYPEQWDSKMIDADLDNIIELGGNVIRIGEFAWYLMERREGEYDFSYFDMIIQKAKKKNIKVIFGTPTATMPAWLAKKEPDVLSEFENGQKRTFGGRRLYCFNSKVYYRYSRKIITALVEHYKYENSIVAWQIDNEFGHEGSDICFCKQCQEAFRDYLKEKFNNDIVKLNQVYGTAFWSQEYSTFDEIPTPMRTIAAHNPALCMDWERFRSRSIVAYANFQKDLIKSIIPDAVVIHDFPSGGLEKHYDYSEVAEALDIVAYNNYPVWGGQMKPIAPHEIAFNLDYMRGLKGKNFWITEGIMGAQGHDVMGYLPRPNQAKMWSYQGMARGCEALMYFRYRSAIKGSEQFCYGILDADNKKRRKYYEVQEFFYDIKKYEKALETEIQSKICMVYDYDSLASFRIQKQSTLLESSEEMKKLYKVFYEANQMVDIIPSTKDFSKYKVVIVPMMVIWKDEFQNRIKEYVKGGGHVILTCRTAVKDIDNNLTLNELLPVGYNKLAGVYVEECESLQDSDSLALAGENFFAGVEGRGGAFREMLVPTTAEVLFKYTDIFYEEYAAVTEHRYGEGRVYYFGCALQEETIKLLMTKIMEELKIELVEAPKGVEVVIRGKGEEAITIILNHNEYEVTYKGMQLKAFECIIK